MAVPHVPINIITVEPNDVNYDTLAEGSATKPGGDIYKALQLIGQTNEVELFESHTNVGRFVQTSNVRARPGFVKFMDKEFAKTDGDDIFNFVRDVIVPQFSANFDFAKFNKFLDELAGLILTLSTDSYNPDTFISNIISDYVSIFQALSLKIDTNFFNSTLRQLVDAKQNGKGLLRSDIENLRRNKFAAADVALAQDTMNAVGNIGDIVMTIPANNNGVFTVVVFPRQLATYKLDKYNNSSVVMDNHLLPVIPSYFRSSEQSEQCLRQWIRQIVSKTQQINEKSNYIILYMGCIALIARLNDKNVHHRIAETYTNLFKIMLMKSRPRSNTTEFEFCKQGDFPSDIFKDMTGVLRYFGFTIQPRSLWLTFILISCLNTTF